MEDEGYKTHDARLTDFFIAVSAPVLWFGMIKKRYTFATEFGPIVQWISTFAKASADKGMEVSF